MGRIRKGKYLSVQAKEIINSCREFCEEERHNYIWNLETHGSCPHTLVPLNDPIKRTSRACKISRRTIFKLKQDLQYESTLESGNVDNKQIIKKREWAAPNKLKNNSGGILGSCDLAAVRKTVHKLYEQGFKVPTLQAIYESVQDRYDFPWGLKTLRSNLNDLGFRWKETENKTKFLMEKSQIIAARSQYIRNVRNYRREGYEIVYVGETCLTSNYPLFYSSQLGAEGTDRRLEDAHKVHILHAACKDGFLVNCLLISETMGRRTKDDNVRNKEYEVWLRHQLIPNLPPKAVVVQGNDTHHCVLSEVVPTSTSSINEIRNWLSSNYIPYQHDMFKAELLSLVRMNKPKPEFCSDLILTHAGFHTIHTPPLHLDLNPMELVWPQVKSYFATHSYTSGPDFHLVQHLVMDACLHVTVNRWSDCFSETMRIEGDYYRSDVAMEIFVSKLMTGAYDSGSSSDFTSSESNSDHEGFLNLPQIKRSISEPKPKGRPRKNKENESLTKNRKTKKIVKKQKLK